MNRPQAERLLGGHAAGILTETEKRALFAAALEHQALFDALMDEEALRELLADPVARRRLLAALSGPEPARLDRFWPRPALIGLAASLFLLATTSLVIWRHPGGVTGLSSALQDKGTTESPTPSAGAETQVEDRIPAPMDSPRSAKAAPGKTAAPTQPGAPEPRMVAKKEAAPGSRAKGLAMEADAGERSVGAELSSGSAEARMAEARMAEARMAEARVAAARVAKAAGEDITDAVRRNGPAAPAHTLERLEEGRYRLVVPRHSQGHLYAVKRTGSGIAVIEPAPGKAGSGELLFEFSLEDGDVLDLYLLPEPLAHPEALPAEGGIQGSHWRLFPEP